MPKNKAAAKLNTKIKPWEILTRQDLLVVQPWVKVRKDKIRLPKGRIVDDYYSIELPEYVVIYAQRGDGKILFERQYKHALSSITLALPGGCIENGELPLEAAKREFLEETGYIAHKWRFISSFVVDGNKGCGKAHFYIAQELEKAAEPISDDMEESEIVFIDPDLMLKACFKRRNPIASYSCINSDCIASSYGW